MRTEEINFIRKRFEFLFAPETASLIPTLVFYNEVDIETINNKKRHYKRTTILFAFFNFVIKFNMFFEVEFVQGELINTTHICTTNKNFFEVNYKLIKSKYIYYYHGGDVKRVLKERTNYIFKNYSDEIIGLVIFDNYENFVKYSSQGQFSPVIVNSNVKGFIYRNVFYITEVIDSPIRTFH